MYCDKEQGLFAMYCLCRWNKEICDVYCVSKYWLYSVCRRIHLQHHYKCGHMYHLFSCLCRRNHLSVYSMYCVCRWDKAKYNLYRVSKYWLYSVCSWLHLQYNDQCCHLYYLYCMCRWN